MRNRILHVLAILLAVLVGPAATALVPTASRADITLRPHSRLVVRGKRSATRDARGPRQVVYRIENERAERFRVKRLALGSTSLPIRRVELDGAAVGRWIEMPAGVHELKVFFTAVPAANAGDAQWMFALTWERDLEGATGIGGGTSIATVTRIR